MLDLAGAPAAPGAGARFVWGPDSDLDPRAAALIRQGFLEQVSHALAHTLENLIAVQPTVAELAPALPAVTCPVLVIVGAQDTLSLAVVAQLPSEPGSEPTGEQKNQDDQE